MPKKVKYTIIIILAAITIIVAIGLFATLTRSTKVTIEILTVPSDAQLTINGAAATPGRHTLEKGTYTLEASREFFGTVTREINTDNINTDQPLYLVLDINTPEAEQYFIDHDSESMLLEAARGQEYNDNQQKILETYPNITLLPYNTPDYEISYTVEDDATVVFVITIYPPNALQAGTNLYNQHIEEVKNAARLKLGELLEIDTQAANITYNIYNEAE